MRHSAQQLRPFRDAKGKRWTHPSVSELMKSARAGECPLDVIRRLSSELVERSKALGWQGPPYDPFLLASLEDIEVEVAPPGMDADARIFPGADGKLLIQYATTSSKERQRFSIAHEIGHTLFPDCFERVRYRTANSHHDFVHAELEQLCNHAASEFLMPASDMLNRIGSRKVSAELAEGLRTEFAVSREAMLRRICDVSPEPCAVAFMSVRLKPTDTRSESELLPGFEGPQEKFRIDYSRKSDSFPYHLPEHKSAPDNSVVYRAIGTNFPSNTENWGIRNVGDFRIRAIELPSTGGSRVAALITLTTGQRK